MRKILMTLVAVLAIVGCGGNTAGSAAGNVEEAKEQNVIEQAVELFDNATKEIETAATAAELEAIAKKVDEGIKVIDESEEMKALETMVMNGDTLALKEFEGAQKALENAAYAFSTKLMEKYTELMK